MSFSAMRFVPSLCSLRRRRFARRHARQRDAKPRTPAESRFESQAAAKLLSHEVEDDVEAKAGSAFPAACCEKRIEGAPLNFLAHAHAVIGYEDVHVSAHLSGLDEHGAGTPAGKGMDDAVVEQVGQEDRKST